MHHRFLVGVLHGAGNDYVYVDCITQSAPDDPAELARKMSNRNFGVGADGLILIEEEHLRRVFGEQYIDFCRRVPRYAAWGALRI